MVSRQDIYTLKNSFILELRDAFLIFDKDDSGEITKDDLGTVLRNLGQFPSTEELHEMLREVDIDGTVLLH